MLHHFTSILYVLDLTLYILPPCNSLLDIGQLSIGAFKSQGEAGKGTPSFTNTIYFAYYAFIILIANSCQYSAGLFNALAHYFATYFTINSLIILRRSSIALILLRAGFYNTFSIRPTILYTA